MEKDVAREGTYQVATTPAHSNARRNPLCCPVSFRHWRANFRNSVVALERAGIWQLSLGCGIDSLKFHGGPGVGKRARRILEDSALATTAFLCCARGACRILWLHNCFWSAGAWRIDAPCVADAVELSADAPRTAIHCVFPNPARADNSDGFDAASTD